MQTLIAKGRQALVDLSIPKKRAIAVSTDVALVASAVWLAFYIRIGSPIHLTDYYWLFALAPAIACASFASFGLYRAVLRYMGRDAAVTIFNSVTIAALVLALAIYWTRSEQLIPRSFVFNFWVLLLMFMGGSRFIARSLLVPDAANRLFTRNAQPEHSESDRRKVAVYGAGVSGFQLFRNLQHDRDIQPVAFIDTNKNLHNRYVGGIRVYGPDAIDQLINDTHTREIFLAMPSLPATRKREILESLKQYPVRVRTVPSVYELTTGRKDVAQLQEVRAEDILGREVIQPQQDLMARCIEGKTVMITGAGGSIGSELCRQVVELKPKRVVLFEQSEFGLFNIEEELRNDIERRALKIELVSILGSVVDSSQLLNVMTAFQVNTLYHAAAYKHVPIVEHNFAAGFRNNVFGTLHTAQAAIEAGVSDFVLVSTDKAVRPTNIMGASKRIAEMVLQALADEEAPRLYGQDNVLSPDQKPKKVLNKTRFTMVRFGNVLESSGSVIPKFRKQIKNGGPLTVTHPNVTRYFMTIPEASQLVIQAGSMGVGGDVFLLRMGEPVRILDLATAMIELSGLTTKDERNLDGDIEIEFTGLHPGEKLFEELLISAESEPTKHPKIMRGVEQKMNWDELKPVLASINQFMQDNNYEAARTLLTEHVDGYNPHDKLVDWTYQATQQVIKPTVVVAIDSKSA